MGVCKGIFYLVMNDFESVGDCEAVRVGFGIMVSNGANDIGDEGRMVF